MTSKLKTQNINGIIIQTGEGVPTHQPISGAIYIDLLTNYEYIYTTGWFLKSQIQKIIEIDMKNSLNSVYTILPQTPNTLFIPTNLSLTVNRLIDIPTTGMLTFSQSGGSGWGFTFSIGNQNAIKEVTYLFNESYNGRAAIDLHSSSWYVTLTEQSNATEHKITLITNGTLIPYVV